MGNQGKNLTNNEDKRVGQSSHQANAELAITDSSYLVSMEESIKQVLRQLRNTNVYSVGIVGENGAGKTTLAKEVGKRVKESKLFNRVIFVTVSKRGNVKRIQDRIAEALGLTLEPKDSKKRARQIVERLRIEGGILIILDDIWDWVRIELAEVGLPGSDNHKGCKLLLTTCTPSLIQNIEYTPFNIHRLQNTAPWSLFKKWAVTDLKNVSLPPKIHDLSQKFVKECRGLPVHLVVAGGCLRSKPIDKWEDAINKIRRDSEWNRDRGYHQIRVLVKWSYKELSSKVAKTLLLITCLFPENEILVIEDLSNYAITLRLCSAKNEVNAAINELICSGLLLHYDDGSNDNVVMQGLVRDAALSIVKEEYPSHIEFITQCVERVPLSYSEFSQWKEEEFHKLVRQIFQPSLATTSTTQESEALTEEDENLNSKAEKLQQQLNEANEEAEKLRQQLNGVKEDTKHFKMQSELLRFNFKFKLSDFLSEALRKEEEEWEAQVAILDQQLNDIETKATTLSLQLINVTKAKATTPGVSTTYADWWKFWEINK